MMGLMLLACERVSAKRSVDNQSHAPVYKPLYANPGAISPAFHTCEEECARWERNEHCFCPGIFLFFQMKSIHWKIQQCLLHKHQLLAGKQLC